MSILAFILSGFASTAIVQPPLALDDPSLPLVTRLALAHGCHLPAQRPWPGESVLACLETILADSTLAEGDRARLQPLVQKLSPETTGWRTLSWGSNGDRVGLDVGATIHLVANLEPTLADVGSSDTLDADVRTGLRVRPQVDVLLGENLALWARPLQVVEFSPHKRWKKRSDPEAGVYQTALFAPVGESSRGRTTDWLEGAVEARGAWGRAWAGVTTPRWGSLPLEPLMLSGNTLPLPGAQVTKSIGPLEATLLFARPIGSTWSEDRAVYAHRWGANGKDWSAGFSEMAITVDRGIQPLYLVPIFPFVMTEHVLGDPDNKQMDFDATWRPARGLELSAELFLDDLQNFLGFFSSGWGNKWGLALGVTASDLLGRGSLDQFQATRMEPWAGTPSAAVVPGKPSNAPVHFGKPLGWTEGPNSAALQWHHRQDLSQTWTWTAGLGASWKGTDSGSSIADRNWRDSSGTWAVARTTKSWLAAPLIRRMRAEVGVERRIVSSLRSQAAIGCSILDRPGKSTEVAPTFQWGISWNE